MAQLERVIRNPAQQRNPRPALSAFTRVFDALWRAPGEGQTRAAIAVVIAGLDPAIHPVRKKVLTKKMDPRVKPAGDGRVARARAAPHPRGRVFSLPRVSHCAGAGVGRGVRGELAVEFRKQHNAVGEAELGAGGGERGILRWRRAVDDEARARKRLE